MLLLGISSRTRSKLIGDDAPTRVMVNIDLVPRGPFRRFATSSDTHATTAAVPSIDVITSPG